MDLFKSRTFQTFCVDMQQNQLLPILPTHYELAAKIDLNGISNQFERQYKRRHYGAKDVYELPGNVLMNRQEYKKLFPNEFKKATKKSKPKQPNINQVKKVRDKNYTIDKKKVTQRLKIFYQTTSGKKQLYFWTITFPQETTEQTGHKLFNIWLTRLRDELNLKSYLWVKERQQNGTIHFHMAVHQRVDVKRANRFMRASIMRAIDAGEINWHRSKATRYNGVDIAKDRKTKRVVNFAKQNKQKALANYLTKYVTKNTTAYEMLAWHCSRDYSNTITAFTLTRDEVKNWQIFTPELLNNYFANEYFQIWYWAKEPPDKVTNYLVHANNIFQQALN